MLEELPPKVADICAFALETGTRQDEIVQLEWLHRFESGSRGILGHTSVKTKEIYLVFLTPDRQQAAKLG